MPVKRYFVQMIIQSKGSDDWRSFLIWNDISNGFIGAPRYITRGYGSDVVSAAKDAWDNYSDDETLEFYTESDDYDRETGSN